MCLINAVMIYVIIEIMCDIKALNKYRGLGRCNYVIIMFAIINVLQLKSHSID